MLGGIESLRASGKFASPREAGRGRRAKRGGRGARPRARARLPLSLALSPLSRGEGIGQCPGVATPGFHGRVKPFGALVRPLSPTLSPLRGATRGEGVEYFYRLPLNAYGGEGPDAGGVWARNPSRCPRLTPRAPNSLTLP